METETKSETKSQRRFRRYRLRVVASQSSSQPKQRCASCGDEFTARYCADLCDGCAKERAQ